jgi:4-amino-4-deoxy-L-arabinose transferase-like glycosyltransferase
MAAPSVWRHRREPPTRFLLAWLVPSWIVFELVVTKLPHYVLPLYPVIAILIAREIERRALSENPHLVRFNVFWPIFAAVLPAGVFILLIYTRGQFGWLGWPFAALSAIFGFYAWRLYDVEGVEKSFARASIAALFLFVAALGVAVPLLRPVFPSRSLAELIANTGCRNPVVASAGFHEPSLVFLVGTRTRLVDGAVAAEILRQGECRVAVIESRHDRAFAQRAERIGLRYSLRGKLENGFNINGGRSIAFSIYRSEPQQ